MKTAYLILTHANPNQLKRLIEKLVYPETDFFVHLDLKSDISAFAGIAKMPNVYFVKNRVRVIWGAYSMIEATVKGFEEIITSSDAYDYVHLISGQDYPIAGNKKMHEFFEANPGKIFMHTLDIYTEWQEAIPRLEYYHFTAYDFPAKHYLESLLRVVLPKRKMPLKLKPVGRSQWFSMGIQHIKYIVAFLKKNPEVARFFNFTWAPDEIVFQTILFASPFKKDMVNNNLRYIDWSEGAASPKTFTMEDKEALAASGKFFARKFNPEKDSKILDWIDENLLIDQS
ncbi:MAG: beta-1,6-N-acetylglucosaminyltransferase [Chitinophagaceae bacterium]|nr:beta-1,6-N-acetylglucosaminyltransferase [Chitinophagaceae bacterium]